MLNIGRPATTTTDSLAAATAARQAAAHRGARLSKAEQNHVNHTNQASCQNPNLGNCAGDSTGITHNWNLYVPTGICEILPYYRVFGPRFRGAKSLSKPKIGLYVNGSVRISGVHVLMLTCVYDLICCFTVDDFWCIDLISEHVLHRNGLLFTLG